MNKMSKDLDVIYFSPTRTTKKVVSEIAKGIGYKINIIDTTKQEIRRLETELKGDAVIIGVPVYEETIPEVLNNFFEKLKANGQPTIIISVYGNIGYGITLNKLKEIADKKNLKVIAAGAFIGEHSFATQENKIALNRPNKKDLEEAYNFGCEICN